MKRTGQNVIVALSGGVDSSVACALLLEKGNEVEAVFMKNWTPRSEAEGLLMCPLQADERDARVVASQLGLKFSTVSFEKEYRRDVIDYLFKEYEAGRTPNPDILCNSQIKFKAFLEYALKRGADYVATGHYVRKFPISNFQFSNKSQTPNSKLQTILNPFSSTQGRPQSLQFHSGQASILKLLKGKDENKDQSYFLYQITQDQLKHCLFPIGEYQKTAVRELAKKYGLATAKKPDSQGICFVGEVAIKEFLKTRIKPKIGDIITTAGKKIGEHEGVWYYTIGQRKGIGIGGSPRGANGEAGGMPYYVVEKDLKNNQLIMARGDKDEALFKDELVADDIHWISGQEPKLPLKCSAKIRYRQPEQECLIDKIQDTSSPPSPFGLRRAGKIPARHRLAPKALAGGQTNLKSQTSNHKFLITFKEKQRAITPGQFVVFYQGEECLGGGKIL